MPAPRGRTDPVEEHRDSRHSAYRQLRERIVQGRLAPGSRLVESEIARHLGLSRTPVRAALERLRQEGYITATEGIRPTRTIVAPLTNEDAKEIYEIVGHIEGLAAREAAGKPKGIRRELVTEMRLLNRQMLAASKVRSPDPELIHELDDAFHLAYVNAGAERRLLALHRAIKPQAERYSVIYTGTLMSEVHTSAAEHEAIAEAIYRGDPAGAQGAVESNWRNASVRLTWVIGSIGERGTW